MIFTKKVNTKKRFKKSAVISLITLLAFLLTFVSSFSGTFAQQNVNEPDQKTTESSSLKSNQIIVKLNNETAAKAEAQITQKDMAIRKGSNKNMGDIFSKYKIKKMEPMYKGLVNWKKKNGKTEIEYYNKIQKNFQKRSKRSKKGVSTDTNLSNTYVIEADVSSQEEYDKLLESLKKDPRFEYAEPSMEVSTCMIPDDPYFSSSGSWGQTYDDLYGVKVTSCPEAWDTATGEGVIVAVVDTGIDNTHPDIANNMWTNTKEIANNGIDDDNNGYIDDIWGWNFVNNNNNPVDDNGHGTHVAGTIAATGNNGIGVVGVAPGAKVMAVKGLGSTGGGDPTTLAKAIVYAAENGADIINCSFGGEGYSQAFEDAVNTAINLGAVVVIAAGNENKDVSGFSPASIEEAITVASIDNNNNKADTSNWGSGIDVAAPGVDILSLLASGTTKGLKVGDKYTRLSGTSMAAPHVSGIAALILSDKKDLSNDQVYIALKNSADDIMSSGFDYYSGYGRVNAGRALQIHNSVEAYIESPVQGSSISSNITVTGSAKGDTFSSYTLEYGKINAFGQDPAEWSTIGQGNSPIDGGKLGNFNASDFADGKYVIKLTVKDNSIPSKKYFYRVEIEVDNIGFTNPATAMDPSYATGIKLGKEIIIQGTATGSTFKNYRLEWGEGLNPTEWHTTGFTLENGGNMPVFGGDLAKWDSGVCPGSAGYYQLRMLVENNCFTNEDRTIIYLEPDLASENWPQKLDSPLANNSCVLPSKDFTGQSSLVGIISLQKDETAFVRYSHDGALQHKLPFSNVADSQVAVGDIDDAPGEEVVFVKDGMLRILRTDNSYTEFPLNMNYNFRKNPVILQDLDGDSVPEILTTGSDVVNRTKCIYAYKLDGSIFSSKFPIIVSDISRSFESNMSVNFLILDINNDGENELITQQTDDKFTTTLNLYKSDGTPLVWQAEQPSFTDAFIKNMIGGDLDHDGQGEIVIWAGGLRPDSIQQLYVINSDGSVKSGWPYRLANSGIDIAIADMDRDGIDEIVYSELNEINVLKSDGEPMSSAWPDVRTRYYGKFSIGDINSDSYPEIIAYHMGEKTYTSFDSSKRKYIENEVVAIDRNAQVIKTWKIKGPGGVKSDTKLVSSEYTSLDPVLGDFNNDGKVDIAISQKLFDKNNNPVDGALTVLSTGGEYNPENMDWPVRLHNPQNTSVNIEARPLPAVTDITLNTTSASISVGGKTRLTATVLPAGANKNIVWSVNNESTKGVAIVAQDGTVTAKLPGTAVIRAASLLDSSKYAECTVLVTEASEGVLFKDDFEGSSGSFIDGWSVQKVSGDKGEWSVVSNSINPIVDNPKSGTKMAKFNSYEAYDGSSSRLYRTGGIDLDNNSYSLVFWMYHNNRNNCEDFIQVQVSTDSGANWENLGKPIYRLSRSTGWEKHIINLNEYKNICDLQIAFLGVGRGGGGIYLDDISVVKSIPVSEVLLDKTFMNLRAYSGEEVQLTATVNPEDATDKNVIWTIQSQSQYQYDVVQLSSTGVVVPQGYGSAIVRATSAWDPSIYADCTITISTELVPVAEVSLNTTSAYISTGETIQLEATVAPQNATNRNVIWTVQGSDNVATVSPTGSVTAKMEGTVVIRANSTFDKSKYAECTVTVKPVGVIPVSGVSLNKTEMTLEGGQSEQLTTTITPGNATNKEVIWTVQSQSTSNVTTVSSTGLVTGTNVGTAVIRATSAADPSKYVECTVTVKPAVIPVTGISLNKTEMTLEAGQSEQLTATVTPTNATNKEVVWTVQSQSASNVATVSSSGLVTGNNVGTAVIRATSATDPSKYVECTVTVKSVEMPVDGVLLSEGFEGTDGSIPAGWAKTVNAFAIWSVVSSATNPDPGAPNSGSKMAKFNSFDARMNTSSRLYTTSGLAIGSTGNYKLEFWMYHDTGNPNNGDSILVQASTNGGSSWISVGSSIRQSDGSTGWKLHTVDLNQFRNTSDLRIAFLAISGNGNNMYLDDISVTCTSTEPIGISLNKTTMTLEAGQSEQLTAAIIPANTTDKEVIWTVQRQSESNVATVSSNGLVIGNNVGTAVIRATSAADPNKYAECTVTVKPIPVTGISLNKTTMTLEAGQSEQLTATIAPDNATNKNVVWMVQGTDNVVSVSSSGLVTAKNPGTAVIRATSDADSSKYAECTVTVKSVEMPVDGVLLSEGFEGTDGSIPAGWEKTVNAFAIWSVVSSATNPDPGAPNSGSKMAKFNSFDARMNTSSRLYTTSGLDIGSTGNYKLEFWMYHDTENPNNGDSILVQASTNGGSSWISVGSSIRQSDGSTGWKLHTVDLNQFRNTNDLRIAFLAISGNGNNMYLDDISVTCTSTDITEGSLYKGMITQEEEQSGQITEPAATDPVVTEPAATEPAATEPAVTEPVVTEPAVTEPDAITDENTVLTVQGTVSE